MSRLPNPPLFLRLAAPRRSRRSDAALATLLATIAGAANAGGFIALGEYASHMTGYLSQTADGIALGKIGMALQALGAIAAFLGGAAFATLLMAWARLTRPHLAVAAPLAAQGAVFLLIAALGAADAPVWAELYPLCVVMGLQNATITKISGAVIRTTHATGMVTDLGIEIGRMAAHARLGPGVKRPDRRKARLFARILLSFLAGGIVGAFGYGWAGAAFSAPLGLLALAPALPWLALRRPARAARRTPAI